MELNQYDTIKSIHTSSYDWNLRVRVQSFWKAINRDTKEFWGLNMIFIDDSNCRIHGYASAKYCEEVLKAIIEGEIYIICNFKVKDYLGDETYRPVRNAKHIYFTQRTKFVKDLGGGLQIEKHAFDIFNLQELEKITEDNRFLIDVAGFVENFQPHYTGSKPTDEKTKVKFDISDGRFSVNVTFFETFGIAFEEAIYTLKDPKIYVIIGCTRVGKYDGKVNLSNYPATRIYINPDHYSIKLLKESVLKLELMDIPPVEEPDDPIQLMSVKDIKLLRGGKKQNKVICQVTVKKVDEQVSWYYAKCTGCSAELQKDGNIYKCASCQRLIPYPDKRFRLCTICSDNSGSIAIIFPNSEICRLIDKTVFDLETEAIQEDEEGKFPPILKQFQRKKLTITLELTSDNLINGSAVYEANEIVDCVEISGNFDPAKQAPTDEEEVLTVTESMQVDDQMQSPNTGNSTTKTRARNIAAIQYNQSDHLPPKQPKNLKTKKQ